MTALPMSYASHESRLVKSVTGRFIEAKPISTEGLPGSILVLKPEATRGFHFDTSRAPSSRDAKQSEATPQWQRLISFIQTQCKRLRPGGTPGSNILIKLICKIPTMWVFRWLIIRCESSLCFRGVDTGKKPAPVSAKRCRKLSPSNYLERGQLQMTVFVFPSHESQILRRRSFNSPRTSTACQSISVFLRQ